MEILTMPMAEALAEASEWDDAPHPGIEEQEMDILAFDLWQRANRLGPPAASEDGEEDTRRCRASCL